MKKCVILISLLLGVARAKAHWGTPVAGVLFNDRPALGTRSFHPQGIAAGTLGRVYIADRCKHPVQGIVTNPGQVNPPAEKAGEPGIADRVGERARFNEPGIAVGAAENSFVVGHLMYLAPEISVGAPPMPVLTLLNPDSSNQVCEGDVLQLQAAPASYSNYRLYLDGAIVQDDGSNEFFLTNLTPGGHMLTAEAVFQGQTIISDTLNITVLPLPQPAISAVGETSFFEGDSVILIASGTGGFLWSNAAATQAITVTESGVYFVEVTENGCTGISPEVTVEVTPLPDPVSIGVEGGTVLCPGSTALLRSSSPAGNQWLKDGWQITGATSPTLEVGGPGIYQVQATDAGTGITTLSNSVAITAAPLPAFDFTATPRTGKPGQEVLFAATGAELPTAYSWQFGAGLPGSGLPNPSFRYEMAGLYDVALLATDRYGCEYAISKPAFIQITEAPAVSGPFPGIFIPNAFTPNGDGENDLFRVRGLVEGAFFMGIYNQWGELIFQSETPSQGWDGNRNGLPVHGGTYVYWVKIGGEERSGHVTLLR